MIKFFSDKVAESNFYFDKLVCFGRLAVLFSIVNSKIHVQMFKVSISLQTRDSYLTITNIVLE